MTCQEFWERGPEGLEHLRECARCAALHESERRLASGLKVLAAQSRRVEAPERLERRLVAEFRRSAGMAPAPRRAPWAYMLAWGIATAAMLLVGFALMRGRQPHQVRHAAPNAIELAVLDGVEPAEALRGEDGFIPLPNAEQIDPGEEVDLVRVQVPRSAMIAMGIPVSEESASDSVQADVVLGADGVARAVRVLDEY